MGKTFRRKNNFNDYGYVDAWFDDFEHSPIVEPFWGGDGLKNRVKNRKKVYNYIHSDNFQSRDRWYSFVKKESNNRIRAEKRRILYKVMKDEFADTLSPNNKRNALYYAYIY